MRRRVSRYVEPFTAPILSHRRETSAARSSWTANEVRGCTKCRLCETRTHTVFGEGAADAKIFFIGEGPGENEDLPGRPFVGRAGELLNKMIAAMGLRREEVYHRERREVPPAENRAARAGRGRHVHRRIWSDRSRSSVHSDRDARACRQRNTCCNTNSSMGRLRGQWHAWRGIKLMPTFHPAYLLRSYTTRIERWCGAI